MRKFHTTHYWQHWITSSSQSRNPSQRRWLYGFKEKAQQSLLDGWWYMCGVTNYHSQYIVTYLSRFKEAYAACATSSTKKSVQISGPTYFLKLFPPLKTLEMCTLIEEYFLLRGVELGSELIWNVFLCTGLLCFKSFNKLSEIVIQRLEFSVVNLRQY